MSDGAENNELVKIDTQEKWTAYKRLVENEFKKRGLEIEPLPSKMPQRRASVELNDIIDEFIKRWEKEQPLQQVREAISFATEEFKEELQYLSHNLSFYWSDITTSIQAITEEILGKPQHHSYFIKPEEILHPEELADLKKLKSVESTQSKTSLKQQLAEKVTADIQQTGQFMNSMSTKFQALFKTTIER